MSSTQSNTPTAPPIYRQHQTILAERAIPPQIAIMAGLRSMDLGAIKEFNKAYKLPKTWPGLPLPRGATGLGIPYPDLSDGIPRIRVRLDETEITLPSSIEGVRGHDEETVTFPRYLAQAGVSVGPYIPRCVTKWAGDPSVPIAIVEAPLKALALCAHFVPTIGLGGVLAGAHDTDILADTKGVVAHPDLRRIIWKGRRVYVVFDAGMWTSSLGDGNPMVALGAAYIWRALSKLGADVRVVRIPYMHPEEWDEDQALLPPGPEDQGPDDFLARHGADAMRQLLEAAIVADPTKRFLEAMAGRSGAERTTAISELLGETFIQASLYIMEKHELRAVAAVTTKAAIKIRELSSVVVGFKEKLSAKQQEAKSDARTYDIKDGAFHHGDRKLSNFTAEIIEDVLRDDGLTIERVYRIAGEAGGGPKLPLVEVPAAEFARMAWLDERWGSSVNYEAGRGVLDHVRCAIKEGSTPRTRTVKTVTGWHEIDGERVFLMPSGAVSASGKVTIEVAPPGMKDFEFPALGKDEEELRQAVLQSLSVLDVAPTLVTMPLLATTYLAPLSTLVGVDFTTFVLGRTGTMKSTLAALAQNHFGAAFNYNNLPGSWFSTATFIEAQLHRAKDVLVVIDNYVPPQGESEMRALRRTALRVLQMIGDRQARGRCNTDATEKPQKRPQGMVMATGEILPPTNESTLGRVIVVKVAEGDVDLSEVKRVREEVDKLSVAMHGFVRFLINNVDSDYLKEQVGVHRRDVFRIDGAHDRVRTSLAMLFTAFGVFLNFARSVGAVTDERAQILRGICRRSLLTAGYEQPRNETPTAAEEYLTAVRTLLISGRARLSPANLGTLSPDAGEIGWEKDDQVWLEPDLAFSAVADLKGASGWQYTQMEVHQQLRSTTHEDGLAVLAATGSGRNITMKRSVGKKHRPRVLVFRRVVFGDALGEHRTQLHLVPEPQLDELVDDLMDV